MIRPAALFCPLLLAACVSVPAPEKLAAMSPQDLCLLRYGVLLTGSPGFADVMQEIERRQLFTPSEMAAIGEETPGIGMQALVLYCTWGQPTDINRTATADGEFYQFVYERYLGRMTGSDYRFAYVEDGKITAIQD